jgi:hypothetical protein
MDAQQSPTPARRSGVTGTRVVAPQPTYAQKRQARRLLAQLHRSLTGTRLIGMSLDPDSELLFVDLAPHGRFSIHQTGWHRAPGEARWQPPSNLAGARARFNPEVTS